MVSLLLMALSLSVDAAAAAVCCALAVSELNLRESLRLGLWFGGFQAGMMLLGGAAGVELSEHFQRAGCVVSFGLLVYLGGKMLLDAAAPLEEIRPSCGLDTKSVALLALATSLDALAAGVSMACLSMGLWLAAGVIGAVAFCCTFAGARVGRRVGVRFHRWASAAGGLVLTGIGVRILLEAML